MAAPPPEDRSRIESLNPLLIAPCGMNCGLCAAHLRARKPCAGCLAPGLDKPAHCQTCRLKTCAELAGPQQKYCFECSRFPCATLIHLDKRYRTKYAMSMIENLAAVRELGLERFVDNEQQRWRCPSCGHVLCVHRPACLYCGASWRPSLAPNFIQPAASAGAIQE